MDNYSSPGNIINFEYQSKLPTEQIFTNSKKYSKSVKGQQCLGPCVTKNKKIIHPVTLETVTDKDHAFCPVAGYEVINDKTNKKETKYTDHCYGELTDNVDKNQQIMNVLIPYLDFDVQHFLVMFYNINTYEEGIKWISENLGYPLSTRERIFECILNSYGNNVDIVDSRTTDFVILLIKDKYIDNIYDRLKKYVYVDLTDDSVKLQQNNQKDNEKNIKIKKEYIIKNLITSNDVSKFLFKFFRNRKKTWGDIKNYINNIINDFIIYSINLIQMNLEIKKPVYYPS